MSEVASSSSTSSAHPEVATKSIEENQPSKPTTNEVKAKEIKSLDEEQGQEDNGEDPPPGQDEEEFVEKTVYTLDPKLHDCLYGYFPLFQRKGTKKKACELDERDLPIIMRAVGMNPSHETIQRLLESAKENEIPGTTKGHVTYENFEQRIGEALRRYPDEFIRHSKDKVLEAFQIITSNERNYMELAQLKKLMLEKGHAFTEHEANRMIWAAKDKDTGKIYIEEYSEVLAWDGSFNYEAPTSEVKRFKVERMGVI